MLRSIAGRSLSLASRCRMAATATTTTATHAPCAVVAAVRALSTGGKLVAALKEENPHVDVVQYEHKNRTWTTHHVDYYAEALAIGIAENGLVPGDVVLSWLPAHFQESVRFLRFWIYFI